MCGVKMNLKEIARARGTNLKKVAEKCGIPASTLYAISRGDTNFDNVGISTFLKIAEALDMDAEELYGRDVQDHAQLLSYEEQELIDIMRTVTFEGQRQLLIYARGIAHTYSKSNQAGKTA